MLAKETAGGRAIAEVQGFEDRVVTGGESGELGLLAGEHDPQANLEAERIPGLEQDLVASGLADPPIEIQVVPGLPLAVARQG